MSQSTMATHGGIFYRPIHCGECGANFDYPSVTMDASERDVPITTRICLACLTTFDKDEDKRRIWAEKLERPNRLKVKDEAAHDYKTSNDLTTTSEQHHSDSDAISQTTESPEQSHARLLREHAGNVSQPTREVTKPDAN